MALMPSSILRSTIGEGFYGQLKVIVRKLSCDNCVRSWIELVENRIEFEIKKKLKSKIEIEIENWITIAFNNWKQNELRRS